MVTEQNKRLVNSLTGFPLPDIQDALGFLDDAVIRRAMDREGGLPK